jgi:cytosine/adenosine deaminase-related metal-dependent hydrolase
MAVPTPVKRKLPLVPLLIAVGVLTMVIWGATHGRHAVEARGMAMVLGLQMTNEAMLQTDQPPARATS